MPENSEPKHAGRYKPGQSGNPAGRPKGVRHKAVEALDLLGRNTGEDIVLSVIQAAKTGDMRAAEIILRRIWPEVKSRHVLMELPAVADASGVSAALVEVVRAMGAGEITPDEAHAVSAVIEGQRRAIETVEIEARLRAVEARINHEND